MRIRITSSTGVTKIFPSPIFPVRALSVITSTTFAALSSGHENLNLHLRQKIHRILSAPIELGVSLLAAESFDLFHRHSLHAGFGQRFLHLIELERLHNRFDHLHKISFG